MEEGVVPTKTQNREGFTKRENHGRRKRLKEKKGLIKECNKMGKTTCMGEQQKGGPGAKKGKVIKNHEKEGSGKSIGVGGELT